MPKFYFNGWPSSCCALSLASESDPSSADQDLHGIRNSDLTFTSAERGFWTLKVRIESFKGYRADDRVVIEPEIKPLHRPGNVFLEPTLPLLALLIHRGALREHGPDGPKVTSMHQLFTSEAFCFIGVGQDPVFKSRASNGSIVEMNTGLAAAGLAVHASALGLPVVMILLVKCKLCSILTLPVASSSTNIAATRWRSTTPTTLPCLTWWVFVLASGQGNISKHNCSACSTTSTSSTVWRIGLL